MDDRPLCIDLFCGRGGWTRGFLAAGFRVIGVDLTPQPDYPPAATFLQADARQLDGRQFRGCAIVVASPPCQEFSRWDQPWTRARNPPPPSLELVEAARRIAREAGAPRFILENVRGAQRWLGKAILRRGPFFLWGDVPLAPMMTYRPKQSYSSADVARRAEIPFELAHGIALLVGASCEASERGIPRGLSDAA